MNASIVYVPVPESQLKAVYRLLAEETPAVASPTGSDPFWTEEKIARLRRQVTNPVIRTALDLCASKPDTMVSIREIETASGRETPTVRAALAGLTMFLKSRFGAEDWHDWPFVASNPTGSEAMYRMTPVVAAWWSAGK